MSTVKDTITLLIFVIAFLAIYEYTAENRMEIIRTQFEEIEKYQEQEQEIIRLHQQLDELC